MSFVTLASKAAVVTVLASGLLVWAIFRSPRVKANETDDEQTKKDDRPDEENELVYRDIHLLWDTSNNSAETFVGKDHSDSQLTMATPVPRGEEATSSPKKNNSSDGQETPKVKDHQKDLEFLASMTFANGGMRAPSCPCCV